MNVTPDNTFADPEQLIADLQRQLSECKAERDEGLQRETAAAEVLQVINSSPGNLAPIFDAILEKALRVCSATFGMMHSHDNGRLTRVAARGLPAAYNNWRLEHPLEIPSIGYPPMLQRLLAGEAVVDQPDFMAGEVYRQGNPHARALGELGGARSAVSVALRNDDALHGTIIIFRQEVRPFSDKEIRLLQNFAAQAVIAMENARLLGELRQSLEQQTATANVLRTISTSPGELGPVFNTMLDNATRLCEAHFGILYRYEEEAFRAVALRDAPPQFAEFQQRARIHPTPASGLGRIMSTLEPVHIIDTMAEQRYIDGDPYAVTAVKLSGSRTLIFVPMLKEDALVGAIAIYRREVRPFTDKQIELLSSFAAQAVIAIENARLLNELRQRTDDLSESLEQQTATSEVLKVISSSPGELEPVFKAMLENATRICEAKFGILYRYNGLVLDFAAEVGTPPEFVEYLRRRGSFYPTPASLLDQVVRTKQVRHTADDTIEAAPGRPARLGGARSRVCVPMLKDDVLVGVISIYRQEVRPFSNKQIDLLKNFAAQAVIAIENARLLNELRESLEQQMATSDVLGVISSSPGELEPVFNAMLENATRICGASFGNLDLREGEVFRLAAMHNAPPAFAERRRAAPVLQVDPRGALGRAVAEKRFVQIDDMAEHPLYKEKVPQYVDLVEKAKGRTLLIVPLLKEDEVVGVFAIYRQEVRAFTDKQIELVQNFAAQAVIAIENTRLLNELRESLQQQTATSEVLSVISSSPGELEPVFNAMLKNAVRICDANFGNIYRWRDGALHLVAAHNTPHALVEARRRSPIRPSENLNPMIDRTVATKGPIHLTDAADSEAYRKGHDQGAADAVELGGVRTALAVPMMRENDLVGSFTLYRNESRPFTEKQIALVANFAAQAVIAIENARLLNELRESLDQQTATSEVLKVISASPSELQPVFQAMLENATRICEAKFATLNLIHADSTSSVVAVHNVPKDYAESRRREPRFVVDAKHPLGRLATMKQVLHVDDVRAEESYLAGDPSWMLADHGGARTVLLVPMLKDNELVGAITIFRQEVRAFTDKQIELVKNFAAQAVIAIENTRLLSELRQRTGELSRSVGELRALGEVSWVVNSTLDLQTVLSTIVAKAVELSGTEAGAIYVFDAAQREFYLRSTCGMDQELIDALSNQHIGLDEPNVAQVFEQREAIQVADLRDELPSNINEITLRAGFRARLVAPLLRGDDVVGLIVVRRRTPGAFPQNIVDLIKTFAAQSAVAIENARLFKNVDTSLKELRTAQDRLVQTQKLASLGQLTAGIAHEIKNPLNFVNNFSGVSAELIDELQDIVKRGSFDDKARDDIAQLTGTLRDNLERIVQHGKRADSIVKNMLLHSRQGSGEHRPVDINALVEESLNLTYHGARAEKQGFNITLERFFDPAAGQIDVFPQEMTRVLLNLISNGFYAAAKRREQTGGDGYEATLTAATRSLGDRVEIRIRDNGTGMPPEVREKIFNPFFTTKPAGEGTGLGLSISHDIIVKQHGGSIEVETRPGEFTEFRIVLPRKAA